MSFSESSESRKAGARPLRITRFWLEVVKMVETMRALAVGIIVAESP